MEGRKWHLSRLELKSKINLYIIFQIVISTSLSAMDFRDSIREDDIIVFSLLYSSITVVFAMAVLSKFLTNEFRFGFRSFLSLVVLFIGEPLCQFLVQGPGGLFVFGLGCLFIYSILPASHLPASDKVVLVTGCDSGFGNALVKKLDSIGMKVFAGCLYSDGPGAIALTNSCSDRMKILQLDITKPDEVKDAVTCVSHHIGEEGLWGLVNNAGVWYFSELEMTSEKVLQKVLDVNLMGAVRVTKACLPLVRKAKGRILNVSSLTGRIPIEGNGAYSMSKHGLVAFSDTLRLEMRKWGVHVALIEPTGFCTGNMKEYNLRSRKEEVWTSLDEATQLTYGRDYLDSLYTNILNAVPRFPKDLSPVIRSMRSALLSKRPRERYPCGVGAEVVMCLYPLLPIWLGDKLSVAIGFIPKMLLPKTLQNSNTV